DSAAVAVLELGLFGVFGGDEVRNAAFYFDVRSRVGRPRAKRIFDDHFPLFDDQSPTTIPQQELTIDDPMRKRARRFSSRQLKLLEHYLPSIDAAAGVSAAQAQIAEAEARTIGLKAGTGHLASNAILVSGPLTDTGHPILLGGPQVGYAIP